MNRRESAEVDRRRDSSSGKRAGGAGAGAGGPQVAGAGVKGGTAATAAGGNEPPKPSIKDFKVVEELGTGNFSTIVKVRADGTGRWVYGADWLKTPLSHLDLVEIGF